ncbi:MAG: hypothetical protein JNL52_05345 [Flavobacteriales bacterium]|nr:hypothetical protein [Flavobacteriales bacterium]
MRVFHCPDFDALPQLPVKARLSASGLVDKRTVTRHLPQVIHANATCRGSYLTPIEHTQGLMTAKMVVSLADRNVEDRNNRSVAELTAQRQGQ